MQDFEPNVVVFCCRWCSYAAADLAGTSRMTANPQFVVIRTMCSGRIDPEFILDAFAKGADGVLVTGCHPGDCHYVNGNYKTRRRMLLLEEVLEQFGIDRKRLRCEWISASEGGKFVKTIDEFIGTIKKLGPIDGIK
ncbi:methyl-viologen-reducing hydrogenase subunit delta [candidate division WOR-3 bacterium JGI_Cruoil_03_44_89]|uniref:Methyl-viologen-reducing hydrogenase subunit delta n=1 Tax=candidate division WOR-3 bacterium JGI_Cruoil_03_44_89 TaxID=1973748 RepID=A0A235BWP4_UNCW3|nr:MAG: methyl-viologen-reducing hydrogenase subunit delta [candidate division WOR-3 bacterium JGI_Cruoil_03_44_89]